MNKRIITVFSIIVLVILCAVMVYRYYQYILVWYANKEISAGGIKLMLTEDKVKSIIGEEEEYIPGFGGYRFEYPSKGVKITFLSDPDTDFYRKVNEIEVTDSKCEIFGTKAGDEFDKAVNILCQRGFKQGKDDSSYFWMLNMYIRLYKNYSNNKVQKITIGVRDRVAGTRAY